MLYSWYFRSQEKTSVCTWSLVLEGTAHAQVHPQDRIRPTAAVGLEAVGCGTSFSSDKVTVLASSSFSPPPFSLTNSTNAHRQDP